MLMQPVLCREVDDDQPGGAQGGMLPHPSQPALPPQQILPPTAGNPQGTGSFANWQGINVQGTSGMAQPIQGALPPAVSTYSGQFLSQSARY